jgi:hypothetical protein
MDTAAAAGQRRRRVPADKGGIARHMKSLFSDGLTVVPNLVGGILFLIGAARLYVRHDLVGSLIFVVAGLLAIFLGVANYLRGRGDSEQADRQSQV